MITSRQDMFAENLNNGYNKSDAYRKAYSPSVMSKKTTWEAASRLSKNPKVIARCV